MATQGERSDHHPKPPVEKRWNILLITSDQLRADALGCYGNPICRTPNLDALANTGVLFEKGYTPNPICVPARASITTGNYSHLATGCKANGGRIRDDQPKLAEHFATAGYKTYACGKLHYVPYAKPGEPRLTHGFEVWDSHESGRWVCKHSKDSDKPHPGLEDYIDYLETVGWGGYSCAHGIGNNDIRPCPSPLPEEHCPDHWVADRTIARLRAHHERTGDQPFLLWCSFPKPHEPLDPPLDYANLYDPRDVPPPIWNGSDAEMWEGRNPRFQHISCMRATPSMSPAARQVAKAYYYALTTFHDLQVGRVLAELDRIGERENTIVVYTAGLQDILPTLATLTGCPLPRAVHGEDLSPILTDPAATGREIFYAQCEEDPIQTAMVTDGHMKYCYAQHGGVEELYDLDVDPQERTNLAMQQDERLPQWRDVLQREARRYGDTGYLGGEDGAMFKSTPLDRNALCDVNADTLGWRWY